MKKLSLFIGKAIVVGLVLGLLSSCIYANPNDNASLKNRAFALCNRQSVINAAKTVVQNPKRVAQASLAAGGIYLAATNETAHNTFKNIAGGIITAVKNPGKTASIAAGLTGLYLMYRKINGSNWKGILERAQDKTRFMTDLTGAPTQLVYWKMNTLPKAADIMQNRALVRQEIINYLAGQNIRVGINNDQIINQAINQINIEKNELIPILKGLENCLAESNIFPRLERETDKVAQVIKEKTVAFGDPRKQLKDLNAQEVSAINEAITDRSTISLFNPYSLVRHWVLPYEAKAIKESWKIRQLLARLDAIEDCLTKKI